MTKRGRSVQWRYLKQRKVARVEQSATRDQGLCEERVGCACAPPIRPTGAPRFAEHTLQALSGGHDMPNKDFIDEGLAACIRVRLRFQG